MRKTVRSLFALYMLVVLVLTACGGGKDSGDQESTAASDGAAALPADAVQHADYADWNLVSVEDLRPKVSQAIADAYPEYRQSEAEGGLLNANLVEFAPLGPDGETVAIVIRAQSTDGHIMGAACAYHLDSGAVSCDFPTSPKFAGHAATAIWSPDGTRMIFYEDMLQRADDSDIWLFDTITGTLANLTDDGYLGSLLRDPSAVTDMLPIWNAAGDAIYFMRREHDAADELHMVFYRIAATGGEPEKLFELPLEVGSSIGLYGLSTLAPNGTQAIVGCRPAKLPWDDAGIWLLDLTTGELTPLVRSADLLARQPDWLRELISTTLDDGSSAAYLVPASMVLGSDGQSLVFKVLAPTAQAGMGMGHYVSLDLTSGTFTPQIDFSQWASMQEFTAVTDGVQPNLQIPFGGLLTPDSRTLITIHMSDSKETLAVDAVPVMFDAAPVTIGTLERSLLPIFQREWLRSNTVAMRPNGRALFGSILLTFE